MKFILIIVFSLLLCSCSMAKKVLVMIRGYEQYRQLRIADFQIKALQTSNAIQTDTLTICKFR